MKKAATRSSAERVLDRAIELTFPASDPISVENAFRSARKRDQAAPSQDQAARPGRAKPKRRKGARR